MGMGVVEPGPFLAQLFSVSKRLWVETIRQRQANEGDEWSRQTEYATKGGETDLNRHILILSMIREGKEVVLESHIWHIYKESNYLYGRGGATKGSEREEDKAYSLYII